MTPEGQGARPQLIQRLAHPFRRVEQPVPRKDQAKPGAGDLIIEGKSIQRVEIRDGKEFVLTEPLFSYEDYLTQSGRRYVTIFYGDTPTQADKEYITQTYTEYLTQKYKGDMSTSSINYLIGMQLQGNTAPPIIVDGKEMSGIAYFEYVREKKKREKQETIARGEFPDIYHPMPLVQEYLHFDEEKPLTRGEQRERNRSITTAIRGQFVAEVKNADIDLIAGDIRSNMWGRASTLTELRPMVKGNITIKEDGTIINRLRSGLALSYPSLDEHGKLTAKPERQLSMGIGYFGAEDEANIITDAQGTIPAEDLKKGIKAYFVERTFVDIATREQKTYRTIIPFAFANSQRTFYEHLADSAIYLDPRRKIQPTKPRMQLFRRNQPLAAAA